MDTKMETESGSGAETPQPVMNTHAIVALSVSAVSLFVLLCLGSYGTAEATSAIPSGGLAASVARPLVSVAGAGAWVVALLGLAWGIIVYFQERTPDLVMRTVGTATLAASTAMVVGLVHGGKHSVWAGDLGTAAAGALAGLGTAGSVLGWIIALAAFGVSLIFATDNLFHTLRRGARKPFDPRDLPVEPRSAELRDEVAAAIAEETGVELVAPRQFVRSESRAVAIPTQEPTIAVERPVPAGWSAEEHGARVVLRAPQGYKGVEFLSTNEDLAAPAVPEAPPVDDYVNATETASERTFVGFVDDMFGVEPEVTVEPAAAPAAESVVTASDAASEPVASVASAAAASPAAAPSLPDAADEVSGIGFADDVYFTDDVVVAQSGPIEVQSFRSGTSAPNDGASAADEIVAAYADAPAAPVSVVAIIAAPAAAIAPALPAADEAPSFLLDDEFVAVDSTFIDDDMVLGAEVVAADIPAASAATVATVAPPAPSVPVAPVAPETPAAPSFEPWDFPQVNHVAIDDEVFGDDLVVGDALGSTAVAVPAAVVADEVAPVEVSIVVATVETAVVETAVVEMLVVAAVVVDTVAAPDESRAKTEPVEMSMDEARATWEAVRARIESERVAVEPVVAVEPIVTATPAPAVEQLALFPSRCDLSKLHAMELDPLFQAAVDAVVAKGRASAVVLQRALGIGYARALRVLDQMTEAGMLGPDSPGGAREILFTKSQWDAFRL